MAVSAELLQVDTDDGVETAMVMLESGMLPGPGDTPIDVVYFRRLPDGSLDLLEDRAAALASVAEGFDVFQHFSAVRQITWMKNVTTELVDSLGGA